MLLDIALTNNARESMEQYMEDIDRDNHYDCDDKLGEWIDEFVNGGTPWWDFAESELTISNINTLLTISAKYMEEYESTDQPEDVYDLLKRYGYWMVAEESAPHFQQLWNDAWEEKFPENNAENEE